MSHTQKQNLGYLETQLEQVEQDLIQQRVAASEVKQQADAFLPTIERAAQTVQKRWVQHTQNRANAIRDKARRDSVGIGLTLSPLGKDKRMCIVAWVVLLGLIYFTYGFFAKVIILGLYAILVKVSINRAAKAKSQNEYDSLLDFGSLDLNFMHFGNKESGDSDYPYLAVCAPLHPTDGYIDHWKIDSKYGSCFNSDFIVFCLNKDIKNQYAVLKLPQEGQQASLIAIKGKTDGWDWKLHESVALDFVHQIAENILPIQEFAKHAEVSNNALKNVASLEQRAKTLKAVTEEWSDIAIEDQTLDRILKLVDLFISGRKPSPKGILMYGPPGTGKTLIARKLAKHAGCHFEAVNISDLKGTHIGQTAPKVKELWQRCRDNSPTILFVDECESVFARRGSADTDSFGNELVQTFISEWDGFNQAAGQVLVIAATNRHDILDSAVLSRFTASIEIGLPNEIARRRILENEFKQAELVLEVNAALLTETAGMSGRDIHTLVATLVAENLNNQIEEDVLLAQIRKLRGKGSTSVKELTWDDIILPEQTLSEFQHLGQELRNAEKLESMGIPTPKGILLYGPPGTGKTQIARVLASQSGLSFIAATTTDLKANYLGQSAGKVKQLFEQARTQAPCIVFIDEIDIVAGARNGGVDTISQEVIGQLLQELDGVSSKKGVFLLAASNHPDSIDSAVLSRMERKIEIGLPTEDARQKIIYGMLAKKPIDFDLIEVSHALASRTEGMSGRDLNSVVTRATRSAVSRTLKAGHNIDDLSISTQDVLEAVDTLDSN